MTQQIRIPKPADPFAAQIAARLEAKRSGLVAPVRAEPARVAVLGPLAPIEEVLGHDLAVIVRAEALRELLGWKASGEVRERTDA